VSPVELSRRNGRDSVHTSWCKWNTRGIRGASWNSRRCARQALRLNQSTDQSMAVESTTDAIRRLRLEAEGLMRSVESARPSSSAGAQALATEARLTRLDVISVELRRIALRAATPDARRDAESLAAMIATARSPYLNKPA
jgi:hypothetical protein